MFTAGVPFFGKVLCFTLKMMMSGSQTTSMSHNSLPFTFCRGFIYDQSDRKDPRHNWYTNASAAFIPACWTVLLCFKGQFYSMRSCRLSKSARLDSPKHAARQESLVTHPHFPDDCDDSGVYRECGKR